MQNLVHKLHFLEPELVVEMMESAKIMTFEKGVEILREEQYVKVLPLVLSGLVKVYSRFDDREILLYYIKPAHSCVMSFSASRKNTPSKVFAQTEEISEILLIPVDKIAAWVGKYPKLANLFYEEYDSRYIDLLETIGDVLVNKMDKRLLDYLVEKSILRGQKIIKISHQEIANEMGSVREVISRVIKKLEVEEKISQTPEGIKVP